MPWLRPAAREAFLTELANMERDRPLSFAASVRMVPRRRTQVLGARNRRFLARQRSVDYSSPLLHPEFVDALARDGGSLGRGDRTAVLRRLVSDLLPDEVLARTTKASFNGGYMARHTREFAASWSGAGVDAELVDPDELRRGWLNGTPMGLTAAMLQSAWLASNQPTAALAADAAD
jgi:asparagine synthase (glutamine-hydrolysing)